MMTPTVFDTSRLLELKGVKHIVLSPGSRNAPLTISFARNPNLKLYNIVDERSAGFIALGIAQQTKTPVVLCCTSGTSLLNYAPAIAEAYYQQIPLIVMSADRPVEWLDQRDGQTINQPGAVSNFVKKTYQLPAETKTETDVWEYNRKLNEAVNLATTGSQGPVHINISFREPFYPKADDVLEFSDDIRIIEPIRATQLVDFEGFKETWQQYDRKLIVAGQGSFDQELNSMLLRVNDAVVVADVIANLSGEQCIRHQDLFLAGVSGKLAESLQPDLLVTFGRSVISKNLKIFLRKNPPKAHWHFDTGMHHADVFQHMTQIIQSDVKPFLKAVSGLQPVKPDFNQQISRNFVQNWKVEDDKVRRKFPEALKTVDFCEFQAFAEVLNLIPENADIHLANSMPVRFANFIQQLKPDTEMFCNRGTSGIDGTNGTAVGHALVSDKPTWLLTGDLSFFYDRNAFFHHYPMGNLKIVVFNNAGGGIFRLIPGPANLPELEQHFETRHNHSAKFTAMEYNFDYFVAKDLAAVQKGMKGMVKDEKTPKLLEIFTKPEANSEGYQKVKEAVK